MEVVGRNRLTVRIAMATPRAEAYERLNLAGTCLVRALREVDAGARQIEQKALAPVLREQGNRYPPTT